MAHSNDAAHEMRDKTRVLFRLGKHDHSAYLPGMMTFGASVRQGTS